ncbi:alpha/beta hydrolase [Furfurilactobacillus entadae]|uniref:alpha/beta hydrolase n=1 Tax=Furfurilactobacillus entadae TaxID=2922307 RepID=UPI0035E4F573
MQIKQVSLMKTGATIKIYVPDQVADFNMTRRRPVVIIIPGGGFEYQSDREKEMVALNYLAKGFVAVTLGYRLLEDGPIYPTVLTQVGNAVLYLKRHAGSLRISANHILLAGFSAGGHVAAMYADRWWAEETIAPLELAANEDVKVSAIALGYPVIGLRLGWPTDAGVATKIRGDLENVEADELVNQKNPPTFIWATQTDELVPVVNTIKYVEALNQAGIPVESVIYNQGPHGLSLATAQSAFPKNFDRGWPTFGHDYVVPQVATWFESELQWLTELWHLDDFWLGQ